MQLTRRQVIVGLTATISGGIALNQLSSNAKAQVSANNLNISDREYTQTSELQDVKLRVNCNYSFDAAQTPDRWILRLEVGNTQDDYSTLAEERMAPSEQTASGSEELTGSIVQTDQFNIDQFQLDSGESQTAQSIYTKLVFDVQVGETSIAKATAEDKALLTITPGEIEATSSVQGSGEIVISK